MLCCETPTVCSLYKVPHNWVWSNVRKRNSDITNSAYISWINYCWIYLYAVLNSLSIIIVVTGFCDAESQNDTILDLEYFWPETVYQLLSLNVLKEATRQCFIGWIFAEDCGPLEPPLNRFWNDTTFNSVVVYDCEVGYDLIGDDIRNCTINGT